MSAVSTNYYYTLFSLLFVGMILVGSFQVYNHQIQGVSETKALTKVLESIAAEGCELLSLVSATNSSAQLLLHVPDRIGEKLFWVRLRSSASGAWLEGGFGDEWSEEPECHVHLPKGVSASGTYAGEEGTLKLICHIEGSTLYLEMSAQKGG